MKSARTALRSKQERDELVEQFLPLVRYIVGRLSISIPPGVEKDDLYAAGVLGLIHAAESYDSSKGASFKTYAYTTVRGAILDELRRQDPVPRATRERIRRLERAHSKLSAKLGRAPTREELGEELHCPVEAVDQDLVALNTAQVLSLEEAWEHSETFEASVRGARTSRPEERAEKAELIERLAGEIARLPQQCCQVVVLYYHEGLLLKEIGGILGISESRVCQILSKAMALLRLSIKEE